MQKLTNVKLKNVLSHENTDCDIAPILTVFTGISNHGKSVIVRALQQACENEPAGINLLRHGAGHGANAETKLTVVDDEGNTRTVLRLRGKSRNEYAIDGETIKAFGLGAPSEVTDILNLSKHAFHIQSDNHFLLSIKNEGEIARILGRTVGLSKIDKAFALISKQKTANDTDLRVAKKDVEREANSLLCYDGVDAAEKAVREFELLDSNCKSEQYRISMMDEYTTALCSIPEEVDVSHAEKVVSEYEGMELKEAILQCTVLQLEALCTVLENIPSEVNVKPAILLLGEFDVVNSECSVCQAKLVSLDADIDSLVRTPAMVETECADKAVKIYWNLEVKEVLLKNQLAKIDADTSALVSIPEPCVDLINETLTKVSDVKALNDEWLSLETMLNKIDTALNSLKQINIDAVGFTKELRQIQSEIDTYIAEHPVCPECGAQQEYWQHSNCVITR